VMGHVFRMCMPRKCSHGQGSGDGGEVEMVVRVSPSPGGSAQHCLRKSVEHCQTIQGD
jgi:hypothetical protein